MKRVCNMRWARKPGYWSILVGAHGVEYHGELRLETVGTDSYWVATVWAGLNREALKTCQRLWDAREFAVEELQRVIDRDAEILGKADRDILNGGNHGT